MTNLFLKIHFCAAKIKVNFSLMLLSQQGIFQLREGFKNKKNKSREFSLSPSFMRHAWCNISLYFLKSCQYISVDVKYYALYALVSNAETLGITATESTENLVTRNLNLRFWTTWSAIKPNELQRQCSVVYFWLSQEFKESKFLSLCLCVSNLQVTCCL